MGGDLEVRGLRTEEIGDFIGGSEAIGISRAIGGAGDGGSGSAA